MKILVIEDEPKTGDYLRQGLPKLGLSLIWLGTVTMACTWR